MRKFVDLTGYRFNKITVISRTDNTYKGSTYAMWLCRCDCGKTIKLLSGSITSGRTFSCGCAKKHGMSKTRLYKCWGGMKSRCYNENAKRYEHYGGRGITVCEEWKDNFQNFCDLALKNGYDDNLTLDRIDVNGDYKPSNCRWITRKEQNFNKRDNRFIEYNGVTKTATEWAQSLGSDRCDSVTSRIKAGWSVEDAVTKPIKKKPREVLIEINGVTKNISQWSDIYKIDRTTINSRLKAGWNPVDAITTPPKIKRKGGDKSGKN